MEPAPITLGATCRSAPTRSTAICRRPAGPGRISVRPRSPYAASKAGADLMVQAYHTTHGLEYGDHSLLR